MMQTEHLTIGGIPAVLYGEPRDRAWLFVHGKFGCKEEAETFAVIACPAVYSVLAIDLPEHGEQKVMQNALIHGRLCRSCNPSWHT